MKKYKVLIELDTIEIMVSASNSKEARKLAIDKLNKKPASKYIDHEYGQGRNSKKIDVSIINE